jgi:hypothetical protein
MATCGSVRTVRRYDGLDYRATLHGSRKSAEAPDGCSKSAGKSALR